MNLLDKLTRSDNIESALHELNLADTIIYTYVDDEDTKQDYFDSTSIVKLVLEQLLWGAYIEVLIEEIRQGFTSSDHIKTHTKKLEELKVYITDLSNFAKENM